MRLAVGVVAVGVAAWWWRDRLAPFVPVVGRAMSGTTTAANAAPWTPVTDSTARRATAAAAGLARADGPAFVAIDGADAAALALRQLRQRLPSGMGDVAVRVGGSDVEWRAVVRPADFGGGDALGPVIRMLPERDTLVVAGTLEGVRAGLGQFRVRGVRFGDMPVPTRVFVPALRRAAGVQGGVTGLADDAFAVPLPASVGDVRVREGRVTFYRATP